MTLDHAERATLKAKTQAAIDTATVEFEQAGISSTEWQRRISDALAAAYLADDDPRWQSGFDGDATLWREARAFILKAAPSEGTFLDVGCATGHLIESLSEWARERGQALEFYGLELDPALAEEARRRLPQMAARIFIGNVSEWMPPRRFSCVRTGLEYVPRGEEPTLLERIAVQFIASGGHLVVGPVNDNAVADTQAAFFAAGLRDSRVVNATDHRGKTRHVVWATVHDDATQPVDLTNSCC